MLSGCRRERGSKRRIKAPETATPQALECTCRIEHQQGSLHAVHDPFTTLYRRGSVRRM